MHSIPELSTSLQKYTKASNTNQDALVLAMRDILSELDRSNASKEVACLPATPVCLRDVCLPVCFTRPPAPLARQASARRRTS